jgi:hypothetical protein
LLAADDEADRSADDRAYGCSGACSDPRKDRARKSASTRADGGAGGCGGDRVIITRSGGATAESKAARGRGRNQETFHILVLQGLALPPPCGFIAGTPVSYLKRPRSVAKMEWAENSDGAESLPPRRNGKLD